MVGPSQRSVPRVLMLAGWSPSSSHHAGTVFQQELVRHYPAGKLWCFSVVPDRDLPPSGEFGGAPIRYARCAPEWGAMGTGQFAAASAFLVQQYARRFRIPDLVRQAVEFGRENGAEVVWAVLSRPTLIYLAEPVAKALDAPLVTTVMDPPERFAGRRRWGRRSREAITAVFQGALAASIRCSVASTTMQEEYKRRYGVDSVVLIHGLPASAHRPAATKIESESRFVIGIAGSIYATETFQSLLSALWAADWRIAGRSVVVRVLGARMPSMTAPQQGQMHIEYLGWRSLEETLDVMSEVDVAYLPYWFDGSQRLSVRLCFPNKLSAYVAAGRPVLYHGPEDASPTRFFQRHPVGLCCHSLAAKDILHCLRRFAEDPDLYARAGQQCRIAAEDELNLNVFLRRFAELIGIPNDALARSSG